MSKKRKHFDRFMNEDDFFDASTLTYSDLYEELKEGRENTIDWILEEMELQFGPIKVTPGKNKVANKFVAEEMLKYFIKHLKDENKSISESCKVGIEHILDKFPELRKKVKDLHM